MTHFVTTVSHDLHLKQLKSFDSNFKKSINGLEYEGYVLFFLKDLIGLLYIFRPRAPLSYFLPKNHAKRLGMFQLEIRIVQLSQS